MKKHIDHNLTVTTNTMKKQILIAAVVTTLGLVGSVGAQAATLNNGDVLSITAGQWDTGGNFSNVVTGSWFGMDTNKDGKIAGTEKTPIAQGTTGLVIGTTTSAGASHGGAITAGDTNAITAPWIFFGNTGSDFLTVAATGGTTGINLSGWTWNWGGFPAVNMGSGAWGTGFSNGVANFTWSGVYGAAYTLDYHATVPVGDPPPNYFGGVGYSLHLVGTVQAAAPVPVPAAVWLFGSGLLGLLGIARRRKA